MASSGRYSKFPKVDRSIPAGAPAQNTIAQAIIPSLSAKEIVALISSERVKRARSASAKYDDSEIEGLSVANVLDWVGEDPERREFAVAFEKKQPKPRVTLLSALEQ
jgi:hypothetical protein